MPIESPFFPAFFSGRDLYPQNKGDDACVFVEGAICGLTEAATGLVDHCHRLEREELRAARARVDKLEIGEFGDLPVFSLLDAKWTWSLDVPRRRTWPEFPPRTMTALSPVIEVEAPSAIEADVIATRPQQGGSRVFCLECGCWWGCYVIMTNATQHCVLQPFLAKTVLRTG